MRRFSRHAAGATAGEACAGILDMVDLRHGPYSRNPPCEAIEAFGAGASAAMCDSLGAMGYTVIAKSAGGFIAARTRA